MGTFAPVDSNGTHSRMSRCGTDPIILEDEDEIKDWLDGHIYFHDWLCEFHGKLDDTNSDKMYFDYEREILTELNKVRDGQRSGVVSQIRDMGSFCRFRGAIRAAKDKYAVKYYPHRDEMRKADALHRKVLEQTGSSLRKLNNDNPVSDQQAIEETMAPEPNAGGDDDVDVYDEDETVYTSLALQRVVMFVLIF